MADLTRNGVVGLELTREEVIDIKSKVKGLARKAQCREVNGDVVDSLVKISQELSKVDEMITDILEGDYNG